MRNKEKLETAIEMKRIEMIRVGMTKGLSNRATVKCSQELDELLNIKRRLYANGDNKHKISIRI
ncbi:aspartyl-phosphate phosphatase Spo0E family protein [Alkalihalobacillus sp. BA299]|uniref:aspartyl-phosphate phosphatase Spo0E family protein n=1 Tax=Alkalihalobacillus sp. BA299 TaxID=2815938 RepID=UPI0024686749|nr:aspartyl-phosphate phosphatase Spo0E family protein [Alkalihalobacillus sp. BA299]